MIDNISNVLWISVIVLMLISSLYFSVKLKFIQFDFKEMIKNIVKNDSDSQISPFSSLMLTLAGRIGVGSISGVALAIYVGGSGAIFWLWMMAFIGAINTFAETVLASKYNVADGDVYAGGPSYYIERGLKKRYLGVLYSVFIIICYVCLFLGIQSNTITKSITSFSLFSEIEFLPIIVGIILAFVSALIILLIFAYVVLLLVVSGTFGVLYEFVDECKYIIVPNTTNDSSLNPDEELTIIF